MVFGINVKLSNTSPDWSTHLEEVGEEMREAKRGARLVRELLLDAVRHVSRQLQLLRLVPRAVVRVHGLLVLQQKQRWCHPNSNHSHHRLRNGWRQSDAFQVSPELPFKLAAYSPR